MEICFNKIKPIIKLQQTIVKYFTFIQIINCSTSNCPSYFRHTTTTTGAQYTFRVRGERDSKLFAKAVNKKFVVYSAVPLGRNSAELYLPSPLLPAAECNSLLIHLAECVSFPVISASNKARTRHSYSEKSSLRDAAIYDSM